MSALQQHAHELDKENRQLREEKYSLDARVSELSHKCSSNHSQALSLGDEVTQLRKQLQELSRHDLRPALAQVCLWES
jgi:uncharacterized protein YhaN